MVYVINHCGERVPTPRLTWLEEEDITPEGLAVHVAYWYTPGHWLVTICGARREPAVYRVLVANEITEFQWEGEIDAAGQATETAAP